jgi:glycosyltransferase involved in cell wall biosynthesis
MTPSVPQRLSALHIGPAPGMVGGTQSVLRAIRDYSIGADEFRIISTWEGPAVARNALLVLRAALIVMRSPKETVIHMHLSNGGAYLREGPLLLLARILRRRTVVSLHGNDFSEFARRHPRSIGFVLGLVAQLTCLSGDAEQVVAKLVGSRRVTQMPNPVPIDDEAPPVAQTGPVVLFAGVVGRRKGADILLEAWRTLRSRGVPGHLRIVGPKGDFDPPALDGVTVEGPVDASGMPALIREARVVALSSRSEGMPVILAEALASGRPFVATPVGGTAQLAPSSESLVPVEDPDALAARLERYLRHADLAQEMGDRGREFCIATRSPEVIDGILRELYART